MSRLLRGLVIALVAVLLLLGALLLALPRLLSLDAIRARVLSAISAALHRPVEAGAIRVEILSGLGAGIDGLVVRNPSGWETEALARIDRLSVKVAFWPLLKKRVEVRRIVLDGSTIAIERDPSGKSSIADLLASPPAAGAGPPPTETAAFVLSRLRISRGRFLFVDRKVSPGKSVSTSLDDLDGEITDVGSAAAARFDLSGRFLADGARNVSLRGTLGPPPPGKGLGEAPLDTTFAAKNLVLARLAPYLGSSADPGLLSLDATLRGTLLGVLEANGSIALVPPPRAGAIPPLEAKLAATLDLPQGSLAIAKSSLSVAKLPLTVEGRVDDLKTAPRLDVRVATPGDVPIENVTGFPGLAGTLPPDVKLAGRVRLDATIRGAAPDLAVAAALDGAPFTVSRAGEPVFAAPALRATFASRGKAPMTGRVTAASGRLQKLPFQDLVADWTYDRGAVTLAPALRAFGGGLRARVEADLAHPNAESRVSLDVQNVDAQPLVETLTTTSNVVSGTIGAKMAIASRGLSWDAVSKTGRGDGRLSLANAELKTVELMPQAASTLAAVGKVAGFQVPASLESTRFQTLETALRLADGRLLTPGLSLTGRDVAATADGWIGLDRTLSYDGRLVLQAGIVKSFGNAGRYLADEQGRVSLPFRVTGQVSTPKVTIAESVALDLGRRVLARQARDRVGGAAGKILGDALEGGDGKKSEPLDLLQQFLRKPPTPTPTPRPSPHSSR